MSSTRLCLTAVVAGLFFLACGGKPPPAPGSCAATCAGCCDALGQCLPGGAALACGSAGGTCSACGTGQQCAAGACVPKGSACVPSTCVALGASCGNVPDGCGGALQCGACPPGQSCGAGGVANTCGQGTCTPKTCAGEGKNCGALSDGCGAILACGTCSGGKLCGGDGMPNVCSAMACTPTTCALAGKGCGSLSDGCGGMLECGACQGGLSCGGGGTPNVCGDACGGCPAGFACQAGICKGGNPETLAVDVRSPAVITAAGVIRYNGGAPRFGAPGECGALRLVAQDQSQEVTLPVLCNSSANVTFQGRVVAGVYRAELKVRSAALDLLLPAAGLTLQNLDLRTSRLNLSLDFTGPAIVHVTGKVLKNSLTPSPLCFTCGVVHFDSASERRTVPMRSDSATGVTIDGWMLAGTYKVSVDGQELGFFAQNQGVLPALNLSPSTGPLTLNATGTERLAVEGRLLINGQAATAMPDFYNGELELANSTHKVKANVNTLGTYYAFLPAGTYEVSAAVRFDDSKAPIVRKVQSGLSLTVSSKTLDFNVAMPAFVSVSTSVTVNGVLSSRVFEVRLTSLTDLGTYAAESGLRVPPGSYRAEVRPTSEYPVPFQFWPAGNVTIPAAASFTLPLSISTPVMGDVSATVLHNGVAPVVFWAGGGFNTCGSVQFERMGSTEPASAFSFSCIDTLAFRLELPLMSGTYRVLVLGDQSTSTLPNTTKLVLPALVLTGAPQTVVLDVQSPPMVRVAGRVLHNGVSPLVLSTSAACAEVVFKNANGVDDQRLPARCTSAGHITFDGLVMSGTYRVLVKGAAEQVQLPPSETPAIEKLAL